MTSFLPGFFPPGAAGDWSPQLSVVATDDSSSNLDEYTFAGVDFGEAATNRLLIIAVAGGSTSTAIPLSSITIGGVSATIHVQSDQSGNTRNGHVGIASATVPTGTSGTIVVTWNGGFGGTMVDMAFALYRVTGLLSTTPTDTVSDSGASPSLLIDRASNGFIVGAASAASGTVVTWPSPMVSDIQSQTDGTFDCLAHTPVTLGAVTSFEAAPSTDGASPSRWAAASWA